jgi:hypothetical protein
MKMQAGNLSPLASTSSEDDPMIIDSIPGTEQSVPTEQENLSQGIREAHEKLVAHYRKKASEAEKKGREKSRQKEENLVAKRAEISRLQQDNDSLRSNIEDLRAQLVRLQGKYEKKTLNLQRAVTVRKKLSLGGYKQKRKATLSQDLSLAHLNPSPEPVSPMDTIIPGSQTDHLNQLGPVEQVWVQPSTDFLELFHLKSVAGEELKGFSYAIQDNDMVDTTVNRTLSIIRQDLGSAPAVCTLSRKRIPSVEQAAGVAGASFLTSLRDQKTVFIGSEDVISNFVFLGTTFSDPMAPINDTAITRVPGAFVEDEIPAVPRLLLEPLNAPQRIPISTHDKHRSQVRVVEKKKDRWRDNVQLGSSSDESDDVLNHTKKKT